MSDGCVLDSSAILAVLGYEPGFEKVEALLTGSHISAINAAEVLSKLVERGAPHTEAFDQFRELAVEVVPFDLDQANIVARLRVVTMDRGLSLADRACLALAITKGAIAVTADRAWAGLDVCRVDLIR